MSTNTKSTYARAQNTYAHRRIHTLTHMHIFFFVLFKFRSKDYVSPCHSKSHSHNACRCNSFGLGRACHIWHTSQFLPKQIYVYVYYFMMHRDLLCYCWAHFFLFFFSFRNFDKMQNVSWNETEQCVE